jgi:acyl-CoA thioester hydrolase
MRKRQEGQAVSTEIRVRYADTDQMGVVYYANYLVWFEVGRNAFFRDMGDSYRRLEEAGLLLPVVEAVCHYLHPARYEDVVTVTTWLARLTVARLTFRYEISRGDTLLAAGRTVHAFLGKEGRPVNLKKRFPEVWAKLLPCVSIPEPATDQLAKASSEV